MLPQSLNLALTGAGPIEAYYMLRNRLQLCHQAPRRIIVSIIASHFQGDALFWPYAATFGLLDRRDLEEIRARSASLGDPVVYPAPLPLDLDGRTLALLYAWRFPTSYAANLVEGGLVRRYPANRMLERETMRGLGYHPVGTDPGFAGPSREIEARSFQSSPLLSDYFGKLIDLASSSGSEILFIHAPVNPATAAARSPELVRGFAGYLDGFERAYPGFRLLNRDNPVLPAEMFGDRDLHLNRSGAERFSAMLARQLAGETGRTAERAALHNGGMTP